MNLTRFGDFFKERGLLIVLHVIILILSVLLITMISIDTFRNISFYEEYNFQKWQFWICMIFLFDFFVEFFISHHKWKYLLTHFVFFIVSIPYQAIIFYFGWDVSNEISYLVRYMPLIRGGYAMAIVIGWFTSNKATGLFFSYIITLFSTVYFASLTFYLFEYKVNPLVEQYTDALWWAAMDVTTVGSNIVAVTGVGRVLSVLLAALGMMMFPIFTVYVTNIITERNKEAQENDTGSLVAAYKKFLKNHPDEVRAAEENDDQKIKEGDDDAKPSHNINVSDSKTAESSGN